MVESWRNALLAELKRRYIEQEPAEWVDMVASPSGHLNIMIVSNRFDGVSFPDRATQVEALVREHHPKASIGFVTLYTVDEAASMELTPPPPPRATTPVTWHDLALRAANPPADALDRKRPAGVPPTVAFYSFKGGVGRTTALIHVAAALARLGRKVVAVDLDLEAPGLGSSVTLRHPRPQHGLVDFFYDRLYRPAGEAPLIDVSQVVGEVDMQAPGRFLVVPAGELSLDYVAKLDDLRAAATTRQGDDLWSAFTSELTRHVEPDVILVDSRTGINQWGALSLLRAADELVVFLYPNDQNRQGVSLLLQSLAGLGTPIHVVFSPVPAVDGPGMERVKGQWRDLQRQIAGLSGRDNSPEAALAEPLVVPYLNQVALADRYPVSVGIGAYDRVAELINASLNSAQIEAVLGRQDQRAIVNSLRITFPDAVSDRYPVSQRIVRSTFYSTPDVRRTWDTRTCIIRGQVGAGKTTLHRFFLSNSGKNRLLRSARFRSLLPHGQMAPTELDFHMLDAALTQRNATWGDFWRLYTLQLVSATFANPYLRGFSPPRIPDLPPAVQRFYLRTARRKWAADTKQVLMEAASTPGHRAAVDTALVELNEFLANHDSAFWLLFDGIEELLPGDESLRQAVFAGLLEMIKENDHLGLHSLQFKVFVQENTWRTLPPFTSYFTGRDVQLDWTYGDFLGLVYQQAAQSQSFRDLLTSLSPDDDSRSADEATLERSLQILWGNTLPDSPEPITVARWIAHELADAEGHLYPGAVIRMLQVARDTELELRVRAGDRPPTDRLLRREALEAGIRAASAEHVARVRKAYPHLEQLFGQFASDTDVSEHEKTDVETLCSIGILRKENGYYRLGRLYANGLG